MKNDKIIPLTNLFQHLYILYIYTGFDLSFGSTVVKIYPFVTLIWLNKDENMFPVGIYLLNVNNRNTRTTCEICSKLTIKTPEQCYWCCYGVFIVNFEHISHLVLEFLLLTMNM